MPRTQVMLFIILIGIAFIIIVVTEISRNTIINGILAILALIVTFLAFLTKNYTYLFEPVMKKKGKNLTVSSGEAFILSPSGNTIITREGSNVYASSFIKIPMYRSATEMTNDEKGDLSRLFSRVIALSKTPIKLSAELYAVNKDEYIAKLRNILNNTEEKYRNLQAAGGDPQRSGLERVRGEVTMWRNLLDSVSTSHSQSLILYSMVTGLGGTDEEASNIAYQRALELAGGISATLGVTASVVSGTELLKFIEPDYMIPVETVSERITKKATGG